MESSHSNNTGTMKFINQYHKAKLPPQTREYWEDLLVSYNDPTSKYYDANFPVDERLEDVPDDTHFANMKPCLDGFPCLLYIRQSANMAYEERGIYNFNLDKDSPRNLGFDGNPKMLAYEISANSDIGSGAFRTYSWSGAGSIPSEFEVRYHPYEADVVDANDMLIEGKHDALSRLVKWVVNCKEDNVLATIFDNIDIPAGTPADQFQYYTDTEINAWLANNHMTPVVGYPAGRVLKADAVANPDGSYDDDQYDQVPAKAGSRVNVMMGNRFIDAQGITQSLAGKQYVLEKSGPGDSDSNAHWVLPYKTTDTGYRYYCAGESEQFKNEVSQYFDVQYLIDYYTFVYTVAMVDNFGKNLMLHTWDSKIWYPCFYDMDTMLGLDNSGQLIYGPAADMLTNDYNTSFSKLWTMVAGNFAEEIRNRYVELRQNGKFTPENLTKCYYDDVAAGQVGEIYFNRDAEVKYFPFKGQYNHMCNGSMRAAL